MISPFIVYLKKGGENELSLWLGRCYFVRTDFDICNLAHANYSANVFLVGCCDFSGIVITTRAYLQEMHGNFVKAKRSK